MQSIIGIDPGNKISGVAITSNDIIVHVENADNSGLFDLICNHSKYVTVVIEDIKPYSVPLGQQVIDTCKFIGELCFRLEMAKISYVLITRSDVKLWVFSNFNAMAVERIDKKIGYLHKWKENKGKKGYRNNNGDMRSASFIFVDDRIVEQAMRIHWDIQKPKPGKKNLHGLSKHSWQALAVATCYMVKIKNAHLSMDAYNTVNNTNLKG